MATLDSTKLAQVAVVVHDIESALDKYVALLGIERPKVIVTDPGNECRATYRGNPTNDRAKLAFIDLGGVQLELIEPIGTDSAWAEGLDTKGPRLHHIAFWTQNMATTKQALEEQGATLMMRGDMGGDGQYAYFDANEGMGAVIEILEAKRTEIV